MREGFYKVDYQGLAGMGFAVLALDSEMVVGADFTGGIYDGSYKWNPQTECLDVDVTVQIPEGVQVVQGQIAPEGGLKFNVKCSFSREPNNEVVEARSDLGNLLVRIQLLRAY